MFPLLALIPTIFSAISNVTQLFSSGKKAIETVTGKPSVASTPEELQDEVAAIPDAQKAQWAEIMKQKTELYQAQNDRLSNEQGEVDTSKISPEAASEIAIMRQTTRPWAVHMMVHYVLFPLYLIAIDVVQHLFNGWVVSWFKPEAKVFNTFEYVFGNVDPSLLGNLASTVTGPVPQTMMATMYIQSVPMAAGIIISYMGLREYGKYKNTSGDTSANLSALKNNISGVGNVVSKTLSTGIDFVSRLKKLVK